MITSLLSPFNANRLRNREIWSIYLASKKALRRGRTTRVLSEVLDNGEHSAPIAPFVEMAVERTHAVRRAGRVSMHKTACGTAGLKVRVMGIFARCVPGRCLMRDSRPRPFE